MKTNGIRKTLQGEVRSKRRTGVSPIAGWNRLPHSGNPHFGASCTLFRNVGTHNGPPKWEPVPSGDKNAAARLIRENAKDMSNL